MWVGDAVSDDDPVPLTAALDGLLRSLRGGAGRAEIGGVFGRWDDAVGPVIAANVRPVRFEHGALLVEVDDPAWATQVRFLTDDIRRRLARGSGGRGGLGRGPRAEAAARSLRRAGQAHGTGLGRAWLHLPVTPRW